MYATRLPSTRQQVIGTFDVTKETAGAEVGDFLPFFLLAKWVLPTVSFSLSSMRPHCLSHFVGEQFVLLLLQKRKNCVEKEGGRGRGKRGDSRGRWVPPYLQELNDRSVSRTEQKVIYIQFRKSQMSIG